MTPLGQLQFSNPFGCIVSVARYRQTVATEQLQQNSYNRGQDNMTALKLNIYYNINKDYSAQRVLGDTTVVTVIQSYKLYSAS